MEIVLLKWKKLISPCIDLVLLNLSKRHWILRPSDELISSDSVG